jgi:hypothetical protein
MTWDLRTHLSGGTRTSVGEAPKIIKQAIKSPETLDEIYSLFLDTDPVVAMRASYVAMKVAENDPESTWRFKKKVMRELPRYVQQEVRWHIPQLLIHMNLTPAERRKAYAQVMEWSETDKSKIVAYYGLEAAAHFVEADGTLESDFVPRLRRLNKVGATSVSNRCRRIAKRLDIEL